MLADSPRGGGLLPSSSPPPCVILEREHPSGMRASPRGRRGRRISWNGGPEITIILRNSIFPGGCASTLTIEPTWGATVVVIRGARSRRSHRRAARRTGPLEALPMRFFGSGKSLIFLRLRMTHKGVLPGTVSSRQARPLVSVRAQRGISKPHSPKIPLPLRKPCRVPQRSRRWTRSTTSI